MRAIGFFFVVLLLWPVTGGKNISACPATSVARIKIPALTPAAFNSPAKKSNDIDTAQLKQSDWYGNVIQQIEESEYDIKPSGNSKEFASPNLQQNLRVHYSSAKFSLQPRTGDDWKLALIVKGVYVNEKKIYAPQDDAVAITDKNKIRFDHNNYFAVEYINSKEGVRQNFVIEKQPMSNPKQICIRLQINKGWLTELVHSKEIHFAKRCGNNLDNKLIYNDLKVWDADNKLLDASFSTVKNEISINVNTEHAVYPLTIDPISTSPNTSLTGAATGDYFGIRVSSAGDVNGDGYSDVIISAYPVSGQTGRVYIYHGSSTGLSASPATTINGTVSGGVFGYSVSSAGDVNGDGYSDIIIGSIGVSPGGAAYIFLGSSGGIGTSATYTFTALHAFDGFGTCVACAGDVNGDGYSDVIIGAGGYGSNLGAAYVYTGSSSSMSTSPAYTLINPEFPSYIDQVFGESVACAGDVNGDGYSDVIVGAHQGGSTGAAYIYQGSITGLSTTPNVSLHGLSNGDQFGYCVASAGDVNGDGYSDVIVGANAVSSNKGAAYIYLGSSGGLNTSVATTLNGASASDQFGATVACAGDINGDGYSDLIVGAPIVAPSSTGAVYFYLGSSTGISTTASQTLSGITSSSSYGYSISSAGDINGDGYSDIFIGAPNQSSNTGAAYLYHGSPAGLNTSSAWTAESNQANAEMGFHISGIASAGDVNGDGYSDVIIGIPLYDNGQTDQGMVWVYYGSATGLPSSPNWTEELNQAGAYFGICVSYAGDVNGDGYGDIIIGATYYDGAQTNEGKVFVYHGSASGLSASPNWTIEGTQANSQLGFCVASAGDINGDGYGDVIISAPFYDSTFTDEGAVYVYCGSSTGLASSPAWTVYGGQTSDLFGHSVAGAGDVNGDGYSDVIVGAHYYDSPQIDEGKVFVYYGSANGLPTTASWTAEQNIAGAGFGVRVAAAGDVNGDGYGDVIIGAHTYSNGSYVGGAAFIYHGSSTGLSATANTTIGSTQSGAYFGIVSSAGDVNGDGYSDVLVGAFNYTNGQSNEGAAYVYLGSSSGINPVASWSIESNNVGAGMGYSVACAGDVNGDGFSDVLVGAPFYSNPESFEGKVFLYYGNNTGGLRNNLKLYNSDLVTPIQQSNMSDPNLFGAGLYAKSFLGRQKAKMFWQTVKNGNPFTGNPITNSTASTAQQSSWTTLVLTGAELKNQIAKQASTKATYIRARVKYDPVTAITGQVYGPWKYPEGFLRGKRDIGSVALPVKIVSFTAVKENNGSLLKWITENETTGIQYEVQHSVDGIHFNILAVVNGNGAMHNEYQYLHAQPVKGENFYRIKAKEDARVFYSEVKKLIFSETGPLIISPNPATAGKEITIRITELDGTKSVNIRLSNQAGQLIWQKEIRPEGEILRFDLPHLPPGGYFVTVKSEQFEKAGKLIIGPELF